MRWLDGLNDNGHEFEQTLGDSEGQGNLACCSPWGHKESDMTERLNNKLIHGHHDGGDRLLSPLGPCPCGFRFVLSLCSIIGQERDQEVWFHNRGLVLNFIQNCLKARGSWCMQTCDQVRKGGAAGVRCEDKS